MRTLFEAQAWVLDRDGTIARHVPYLHQPHRVELLPGVRDALWKAKELGIQLFIYTNQSGIHRGYYGWREFDRTQKQIYDLLGMSLADFVEVCGAPETPEESVVFRKPYGQFVPQILVRHQLTAADCVMIGDSWVDVQTGLNYGLQPVALGTGDPVLRRSDPRIVQKPQIRFYQDWLQLLAENGN